MAFVAADFSLVNYSGNGFHIWHYKSDDLATAIMIRLVTSTRWLMKST